MTQQSRLRSELFIDYGRVSPRTRKAREAIRNDNPKLKEIQIQARSSRISRFVFYTCAFKKQNKKLRRAQRSKQTLDLTGG